ncbi:MAG: hypothetical protein ISR59_04475 [Anaerolineales bacterium]|uniref:Uncharacterized protein n=1 Tax=Candidatus Desulfolinea nitratireducens TaxID=2841698 RepID=A0A8J6NN48_9CHLR|nr:hypothetical protein [Candidatus Desulfolinea nitratireducens]MBL6960342.1 hypothetical protein [Anaerolineales bacterium]
MTKPQTIKETFDFLVQHALEKTFFSAQSLAEKAEWNLAETEENIIYQLSDLIEAKGKQYLAKPEILRVRLSDFKELLHQKKRLFTDYILEVSPSILIYEFFMPLSREDRLREALDNLFYRDTIEQRVQEIGLAQIRAGLNLSADYSDEKIRQLVFDFMESTIGGYSIYLVNGRYRADQLASRAEVVNRPFAYGPYIVDETTAIVRFILPVETDAGKFAHGNILEPATVSLDTQKRSKLVRWLFLNFFAEALIRVVQNEDEIWLLESGMRSAFYRWIKRED